LNILFVSHNLLYSSPSYSIYLLNKYKSTNKQLTLIAELSQYQNRDVKYNVKWTCAYCTYTENFGSHFEYDKSSCEEGIYRVQFREKQREASSDICKIPKFSKAPPIASAIVT